jgi:hypothetical protein
MSSSRNIFQLPNGFIREAPQAPRAGSTLFLGAPGALAYTDWERGGNYLLSTNTGPIVYRFAADVERPHCNSTRCSWRALDHALRLRRVNP